MVVAQTPETNGKSGLKMTVIYVATVPSSPIEPSKGSRLHQVGVLGRVARCIVQFQSPIGGNDRELVASSWTYVEHR